MTCQKTGHNFTKIAFKPLYTNLFNIVLISFFLSLGSGKLYSQDITKKNTAIPPKKQSDSFNKTVSKDATPALNIKKEQYASDWDSDSVHQFIDSVSKF